jgi:hypothetical protein
MAITGTNGVTNFIWKGKCSENISLRTSIADPDPNPDPDPPDPRVFGPPGSGSGSFYHHAKIVRKTLIPTIL